MTDRIIFLEEKCQDLEGELDNARENIRDLGQFRQRSL
jgi:hypothetical protein